MLTLLIIALILGLVLICISGVCVVLIDPIIAILVIMGLVKLVKKVTGKKK